VAADAYEVDPVVPQIIDPLSESLSSIDMQECRVITQALGYFLQWLDYSRLIVDMHDRHQQSVVP
jgi:hypothetical protein